jgi:hypothetical protein
VEDESLHPLDLCVDVEDERMNVSILLTSVLMSRMRRMNPCIL